MTTDGYSTSDGHDTSDGYRAVSELTIGVIGGTGAQGRGLAYRLAQAGQRVVIGSRSAERAVAYAAEVAAMPGVTGAVTGTANTEASHLADAVVIAVPWDGHAETVSALRNPLAGKVVVDCVRPLAVDAHGPYPLRVPEGSAAEQCQSLLPESRVVAAFHHTCPPLLLDPSVHQIDLDVAVLGDDLDAVAVGLDLAGRVAGVRGFYAGRLRNAGQVEALAANLLAVNERYGAQVGLRVTNVAL